MALTPDEHATLARLDREVSGDPDVGRALRSLDRRQRPTLLVEVVAAVLVMAGLIAVVALLAVSYIASFVAFVGLVIGIELLTLSERWQQTQARLVSSLRGATTRQSAS